MKPQLVDRLKENILREKSSPSSGSSNNQKNQKKEAEETLSPSNSINTPDSQEWKRQSSTSNLEHVSAKLVGPSPKDKRRNNDRRDRQVELIGITIIYNRSCCSFSLIIRIILTVVVVVCWWIARFYIQTDINIWNTRIAFKLPLLSLRTPNRDDLSMERLTSKTTVSLSLVLAM